MLQNACFLAKIGADTAENEQHLAEILPKTGNDPTGPPGRGYHVTADVAPELVPEGAPEDSAEGNPASPATEHVSPKSSKVTLPFFFFSRRCFEEVGKREKLGEFEN